MPDEMKSKDKTQKSDYWKNIKETFEYIKIFSKAFVGIKPAKKSANNVEELPEIITLNEHYDSDASEKYDKWIEYLKRRLGINFKAGLRGGGEKPEILPAISPVIKDSLYLKSNAYMEVEKVKSKNSNSDDYRKALISYYMVDYTNSDNNSNTILDLYTKFSPRLRKFNWPENFGDLPKNLLVPDIIMFYPNLIVNTALLTLQLAFMTTYGASNSLVRSIQENKNKFFNDLYINHNSFISEFMIACGSFLTQALISSIIIPAYLTGQACSIAGEICGKSRRLFDALSNVVSSGIANITDFFSGTKDVGVIYPTVSSSMRESLRCLFNLIPYSDYLANQLVKVITIDKDKVQKPTRPIAPRSNPTRIIYLANNTKKNVISSN